MDEASLKQELYELELQMATDFGLKLSHGPYSALPTPTSIRILKIIPGQPLRCSFAIVDLDDLPVYSALSYTWGNPRGLLPPGEDAEADRIRMSTKHPILCDGKVVEVTANCFDFLQKYQKLQANMKLGTSNTEALGIVPRDLSHIWIDAICINQKSIMERNAQVRVMNRVYRQAVKVLIWLGLQDELTEGGSEAMLQLASMAVKISEIPKEHVGGELGTLVDSPFFRRHGLPNIRPEQWQGLLCLFRRTWFARSWTVQEYALGRELVIICGTKAMNWIYWRNAAAFLLHSEWLLALSVLETSGLPGHQRLLLLNEGLAGYWGPRRGLKVIHNSKDWFHEAVLRLSRIKGFQGIVSQQRWIRSAVSFPLQSILSMFFVSLSSLPQDRIYAYLGLVPEASWQGLSIDYARPISDTYVEATWAMIKSTNSLSILSFVEDRKLRKLDGLPSWVPDYSATRTRRFFDEGSMRHYSGPHTSGHFESTKGSIYTMTSDDTLSRSLPVFGMLHGVIEHTVLDEYTAHTGQEHLSCLAQPNAMLKHVQRLPLDNFWRTIISDTDIWTNSHPATPNSARSLFGLWTSVLSCMMGELQDMEAKESISREEIKQEQARLRNTFISYVVLSREHRFLEAVMIANERHLIGLSTEDVYNYIRKARNDGGHAYGVKRDTLTSSVAAGNFSRALSALSSHMTHRKLFTISSGQIGKGPCSIRSGDEIWVLRGANVPYVLRPVGDSTYELLGEAYVHNIMHGEVLDYEKPNFEAITLV